MQKSYKQTERKYRKDSSCLPWNYCLYLIVLFLLIFPANAHAQWTCPPNINFEAGNLSVWKFYVGSNNGNTFLPPVTSSSPLSNRHVLTSGPAVDKYGSFPIVDQSAGS